MWQINSTGEKGKADGNDTDYLIQPRPLYEIVLYALEKHNAITYFTSL